MSIWTEVELEERESLQGDLKTDVLIIGGGMAGVLSAYLLKEKGVDCVLIEAGRLGMGITKNTTAKITSQHNLIYDKLIKNFGRERASQYLTANQLALHKYKELCQNFDCDFVNQSAYVYNTKTLENLEREMKAMDKLNFPARLVTQTGLPFPMAGAIAFDGQAQFHPLKFLKAISKDLAIYENTRALSVNKNSCKTERARIRAQNIIVATHYPFINIPGFYFTKLYQQRSYVLALENAGDCQGMYIEEGQNAYSFRNQGTLLLLGGGGHRTGKNGGGYRQLRAFAKSVYPQAREVAAWATQDCMSLDAVPYIGKYGKTTDSLFVTTGFNKWGMSSSMVGAMLLRDQILGKRNDLAPVFSAQRFSANLQLVVNGIEMTSHLINLKPRRCAHMGCALKYNRQEHTWDCACHGSRFEMDGSLIDNPATKGLYDKKL